MTVTINCYYKMRLCKIITNRHCSVIINIVIKLLKLSPNHKPPTSTNNSYFLQLLQKNKQAKNMNGWKCVCVCVCVCVCEWQGIGGRDLGNHIKETTGKSQHDLAKSHENTKSEVIILILNLVPWIQKWCQWAHRPKLITAWMHKIWTKTMVASLLVSCAL